MFIIFGKSSARVVLAPAQMLGLKLVHVSERGPCNKHSRTGSSDQISLIRQNSLCQWLLWLELIPPSCINSARIIKKNFSSCLAEPTLAWVSNYIPPFNCVSLTSGCACVVQLCVRVLFRSWLVEFIFWFYDIIEIHMNILCIQSL